MYHRPNMVCSISHHRPITRLLLICSAEHPKPFLRVNLQLDIPRNSCYFIVVLVPEHHFRIGREHTITRNPASTLLLGVNHQLKVILRDCECINHGQKQKAIAAFEQLASFLNLKIFSNVLKCNQFGSGSCFRRGVHEYSAHGRFSFALLALLALLLFGSA